MPRISLRKHGTEYAIIRKALMQRILTRKMGNKKKIKFNVRIRILRGKPLQVPD